MGSSGHTLSGPIRPLGGLFCLIGVCAQALAAAGSPPPSEPLTSGPPQALPPLEESESRDASPLGQGDDAPTVGVVRSHHPEETLFEKDSGRAPPVPPAPTPPRRQPTTWRLITTPMFGVLRNTIRFEYDVPTGPDETTPRTKELDDRGWGTALSAVFVYENLSITDIFFIIPQVNSSRVIGNVFSVNLAFPLFWRCSLTTGIGLTYHNVDTDLRNFEDTVTKQGVSATAHFDEFRVKNDVVAPFPKLGLKIDLPIQHWHVTPYVSYLYEALKLRVSSPGGTVYIPEPVDETKIIPAIEADTWKHYHSFLVGLDFFLDFHYALQLRVKMHYNVNHELFTIRSIASAFFSRRIPLGLTLYFEYSQGIIHDNIYGFLGPSYMF